MQALGPSVERRPSAQVKSLLSNLSVVEKLPLALAGGVVLGLSSPGTDIWWCAWIGLASLLILIRACRSLGEGAGIGFLFGFSYQLVALRWIMDLKLPEGGGNFGWTFATGQLLAVVATHQAVLFAMFAAFVFALPLRAGFIPHFRRPFYPYMLSVPLIWLFIMWGIAPAEFFGGLPIAQLAYTQPQMLEFLQVAKIGGSQLVDFLIVMFNCAVAQLLIELLQFSAPYASRIDFLGPRIGACFDLVIVWAGIFLITLWGGGELRSSWLLPDDQIGALSAPPITVAVVQPDLAKRSKPAEFLSAAQNLGVNMVFLPELAGSPSTSLEYRSILRRVAVAEKKDIVVGLREKSDDSEVQTLRIFTPIAGADSKNIAAKSRLLPFFDFQPWYSMLVPLSVQKQLAPAGETANKSGRPALLKTTPAKVSGFFFNEILYPELIAGQASKGASLFVHMSDLSVYRTNMLCKQLIAAGQLRAIENGRYLIMSENGAVSTIIDPCGVQRATSFFGKPGSLVDRVQFIPSKTRYTSWWWLWTPFYRVLNR